MVHNSAMRNADRQAKPLIFAGNSEDEIFVMPAEVKRAFGYALRTVQDGQTPESASPFEGGKANEIMKLTERHDGDTFRCVYAAKFERAVYVLYVFQKKSHSGIATPQKDVNTVNARYAAAKADYEEHLGG